MVTIKPILRLRACLLMLANVIGTVVFILGKAVKLLLKAVFFKYKIIYKNEY